MVLSEDGMYEMAPGGKMGDALGYHRKMYLYAVVISNVKGATVEAYGLQVRSIVIDYFQPANILPLAHVHGIWIISCRSCRQLTTTTPHECTESIC